MNNRCPLNVKSRTRSLQKLNKLFAVTYGSQKRNQIQIAVWWFYECLLNRTKILYLSFLWGMLTLKR